MKPIEANHLLFKYGTADECTDTDTDTDAATDTDTDTATDGEIQIYAVKHNKCAQFSMLKSLNCNCPKILIKKQKSSESGELVVTERGWGGGVSAPT